MIFWFSVSALCLIAILFMLWPLFSKSNASAPTKSAVFLIASVAVLVPVLALLLYWHWGTYTESSQVGFLQERIAEVKEQINRSGSHQFLITEFEEHLKAQPKEAKGWYLLGKLYLHDARYEEAVKALRQANQLESDNLEMQQALAQALYLANHNALNAESRSLLLHVIEKAPDSPLALTLLGTDEYNNGHYQKALTYFEQLLPLFSPESKEGEQLLAVIARIQKN